MNATVDLERYLAERHWEIVHRHAIPGRPGSVLPHHDLDLSPSSVALLRGFEGLYRHQRIALEEFIRGKNVCLATATASGKTLVFHLAALERLAGDPSARILAIYPLKALAREQQDRWAEALRQAGLEPSVGRIDGSISTSRRKGVLKSSKVLVTTPDILHAWLLPNANTLPVAHFLRHTTLVIADEVHSYAGVFGSNAAFLYRRLNHLIRVLGGTPRYIAASATIAEPSRHVRSLVGLEFSVIGPEQESAPRHPVDILMVNPPPGADTQRAFANLMGRIASDPDQRFLAFLDSRKQAESLAAIVARPGPRGSADDDAPSWHGSGHLDGLQICPYRAGYEEADRALIQDRLREGGLRGVISTSALEVGLDLPHLTTALLYGVPTSATSLYQRIGRIGRRGRGTVLVINNGSVATKEVFRHPERLMSLPLAEGRPCTSRTRGSSTSTPCAWPARGARMTR